MASAARSGDNLQTLTAFGLIRGRLQPYGT